MSKLTWDDTGKRFYESGNDHGVLYIEKPAEGQTPADPYGKGVAWNGLTGVTESPSGADVTDMWADNIKYASLRAAENFGMTIEAYTYPDEFAECDGSVELADGVTIGQQGRKNFGFSFRSNKGSDANQNAGYILHLVYGCTASPSEKAYTTINDSPDAITFSWEVDTTPVPVVIGTGADAVTYKPTACIKIDSTQCDATKLAALEAVLYGGDNTDARLPLPAEVAGFFA